MVMSSRMPTRRRLFASSREVKRILPSSSNEMNPLSNRPSCMSQRMSPLSGSSFCRSSECAQGRMWLATRSSRTASPHSSQRGLRLRSDSRKRDWERRYIVILAPSWRRGGREKSSPAGSSMASSSDDMRERSSRNARQDSGSFGPSMIPVFKSTIHSPETTSGRTVKRATRFSYDAPAP